VLKIREASIKDIEDITKVYNEAILKTNATFDIKEKTEKEMEKWFKNHGSNNPIIVTEKEKKVVGWAALSKYDSKKAYSKTAEVSIYVLEKYQGEGIGKKLMEEILKEGKNADIHAVIARITKGNDISLHLHKEFGFERIGTLREVGKKFGKILDVYIFECLLK
jgi:phosphinothricin acetyltransferase